MGRLEAEMSNAEFVEWAMYHARRNQRRELAEKQAKHRR